ncbi:MAG: TonB-dependent receptor [Candidatus Kapabacteria bacterium]|nr:TonB-dependent receptor [Candidatus Kapabacteria bacterium]
MKYTLLILITYFSLLNPTFADDQNNGSSPTQTIKGRIVNLQTQQLISGATARVISTTLGSISDNNGIFRIKDVPVGRQKVVITFIGFEPQTFEVALSSGKEVEINVQLKESVIQAKTLEVFAAKENFRSINEAAFVSSTLFNKDDVERFAGSRNDPARMAQNFAGVVASNDSRNDIIIRGGSPTELLWRLDGLDFPNPNHFATQGATGGPICAINSLLLDNSDFLTGAFPSEYGGKMSGVFDLHTRRGNRDKYEYMGQFGFNGIELGAEGPIVKENSSFIFNYRYSFLDIMDKMGFKFSEYSGIPKYQDGMLKVDYDINSSNKLWLTGLFGKSSIDIYESKTDNYYSGDFNILNGTDIYSLGLNWQHLISEQIYGKLTIGAVYNNYRIELDSITADTVDGKKHVKSLDHYWYQNSSEAYKTIKYDINYSPNPSHNFSLGTELRFNEYNFDEHRFTASWFSSEIFKLKESGTALQTLSFINWNWRATEDFTINAGIHSQYLKINDKITFEPRLSAQWKLTEMHSFNAGFGIHCQTLPLLLYYENEKNKNLDFEKAKHFILGYTVQPSTNLMLKIETYYKDITNAPVKRDFASAFSFLNAGTNYGTISSNDDPLKSTGSGRAYGLELSVFKHFADGYYVTATGSYVRQQYKGSDNVLRWGGFDNIIVTNVLAGYEWKISKAQTLEFSGKFIYAGGLPYSPIDSLKSMERHSTYFIDSLTNNLRLPFYSKTDIKIEFRDNYKSFAMISYFSIENVFNTKNILQYLFDPSTGKQKTVYQSGFFPVGGIRVEF